MPPKKPAPTTTAPATPPATTAPTNPDDFLMAEAEQDSQEIEFLPRLKIEQKNPDTLGKIVCEDMAESWDTMNLVLLRKSKSRVLWPEDFSADNTPICKSHDGVTPVPADDLDPEDFPDYEVQATSCETCPLAAWKRKDGKNVAPRCTEQADLLVVDTDLMIPFFITFSSLGLSRLNKQLLKPLKLRKMALTAKRRNAGLPPAHECMFSWNIAVEFDERPSGTSYQPVFNDLTELSDEEKELFVQVAIACRDFDPHARRPDDELEPGDGGENGPGDDGADEQF